MSDIEDIKKNISSVFRKNKALVTALCHEYAAIAEKNFREAQPSGSGVQGKFWTNRTSTAADTVFSGVIVSQYAFGFFLAQAVEYGVYLELANDRAHESLRPVVMPLKYQFLEDLREIYE